jgi:cytosine permease
VAGIALVVGMVYAVPVIFGIKSMALVRQIAIPAMVLFIVYYLIAQVYPARARLFDSQGSGDISFWTGVGIAWATFAVSGTMTGDIVRWTKTGKQAVSVTGVAFLLSNGPFMVLGAIFAAAINDPSVPYFLNVDSGPLLFALAAIAILSTWSTADACLYNASLGYSNGVKSFNWNRAAMFATALGIALAMTGLIANVTNILVAIGLVVPPVGAAIIADFFIMRRGVEFAADRRSGVNAAAILATLSGIGAGIYAYFTYPTWIFGIPGMVVTIVVYVLLGRFGDRLGAETPIVRNRAQAEPMPVFSTELETV